MMFSAKEFKKEGEGRIGQIAKGPERAALLLPVRSQNAGRAEETASPTVYSAVRLLCPKVLQEVFLAFP